MGPSEAGVQVQAVQVDVLVQHLVSSVGREGSSISSKIKQTKNPLIPSISRCRQWSSWDRLLIVVVCPAP